MAFNSQLSKNSRIFGVFCEQRDGKLMNTDFESISEGRNLAISAVASWLVCCWVITFRVWQKKLAVMAQIKLLSVKIPH